VLYSCLIRLAHPQSTFALSKDAYTWRRFRETGAFAEGMHENRPSGKLVRPAYSRESVHTKVVAGDADRDPERRRPMAAERISVARQRLAIGRSSAGVPRTYRVVRSWPWGWRLAVFLRRLVP
jgi:hypothetical protein